MGGESVLLVDADPRHTRLVNADGQPVWPVRTDIEHAAVSAFAAKFGIEVRAVRGRKGSSTPSAAVVVAWGPNVLEEARLYAHLTRRRLRVARTLRDLGPSDRPAVVVTTLSRVRNDLLSVLYSSDAEGPAPGLICAPTADELRPQVLVRAAAAALQGPQVPRLSLSDGPPPASRRDPDAVELGIRRDPSRLLQRLAEGVGVTSIMAHSDGIDGMLGSELILCPMDKPPRRIDPRFASRCSETGFCHRLRIPVTEALASSRLVPPEVLSSWCLVWGACWGVLPPDGIVDPAAGLAPRLLGNPTLGAILTTWDIAPISYGAIEYLARSLHAGITAGEALQGFLGSPLARRTGLRFCLFGDPQVSVPPSRVVRQPEVLSSHSSPPPSTQSPTLRLVTDDTPLADVAFLRAYLEEDARRLRPDLRPLAAEVSAALDRYAAALEAGKTVEEGDSAPGPSMRRVLVDYLGRRGPRIFNVWLPIASPDEPHDESHRRCDACQRPHNTVTSLLATVDVSHSPRRRLSFCPSCGITEDAPVGSDATLSLGVAQTSHLRYRRAFGKAWAGVLVVRSQMPYDRMVWDWPAGTDGRPARRFAPTETWPVGPLDVGIMIVSDAKLTIVMQRGRRTPPGAAAPR